MKLERISENQIRCTLTRSDLADRELKLSELAYGSAKAKALFQDMMLQASDELGFEADNIPLVIEAVPISNECIVLIVTKVEDPEELDTRFSKFSSLSDEMDEDSDDVDTDELSYTSADAIMDLFKRLSEDIIVKKIGDEKTATATEDADADEDEEDDLSADDQQTAVSNPSIIRIYSFPTLEDVTAFSLRAQDNFTGINSLYKNPSNHRFYLVLYSKEGRTPDFEYTCHLGTEFGALEKGGSNTIYYYGEHYDTIIRDHAIQTLASL